MLLKSLGVKVTYVVVGLVCGIGFMRFFTFSSNEESSELSKRDVMEAGQPLIPEKVVFAGEPVPLEYYDVKEALDREILINVYWHSQTMLLMKRANRYFPIIEPILKEYEIPEDFKYLAVIESGLQNVGSPAGAKGVWQILESTAKESGLEVNADVDERLDLEKSTRFACKYFLWAYKTFKSWPMAAASYNMGVGGLSRSVENQGVNNFYDLWLNAETARYVYRIIAAKLVMEHPRQYGINLTYDDLYCPIPTTDAVVDTPVGQVANLAKKLDVSYKTLKLFNPWLVSTVFPNKNNKKYIIKVPEKGHRELTFGRK